MARLSHQSVILAICSTVQSRLNSLSFLTTSDCCVGVHLIAGAPGRHFFWQLNWSLLDRKMSRIVLAAYNTTCLLWWNCQCVLGFIYYGMCQGQRALLGLWKPAGLMMNAGTDGFCCLMKWWLPEASALSLNTKSDRLEESGRGSQTPREGGREYKAVIKALHWGLITMYILKIHSVKEPF